MRRLHSIRTRIFGGFLAVLLLQIGLAAAVWRAESRLDYVAASAATSEAQSRQLPKLLDALHATRLRLSNFLRIGGVAERKALETALSDTDERVAAIAEASERAQLVTLASGLRDGVHATMSAAAGRRDVAASIAQVVTLAQNASAALAQAASLAPTREGAEAVAAAAAATAPPLTAAMRFSAGDDARDRTIAHDAAVRTLAVLHALVADQLDLPQRATRLIAILDRALTALDPAMTAAGAATTTRKHGQAAVDDLFDAADRTLLASLQAGEA